MSMHDLFTEAIKEFLKGSGLRFIKLEEEIRIFMRGKPDISVVVEDKRILKDISEESWLYVIKRCMKAGVETILIEVKTEKATGIHIYQLYKYKMSLILSEELPQQKICAILICPKLVKINNIIKTLSHKTGLKKQE